MTGLRRWLPLLALAAVAVVALAIGTHRASHPTLQSETVHIANMVSCPVCSGETAAQSQAPASIEIRSQIQQELQKGQSQSQILAGLVAAYGPGILEKPEAKGVGLLVWVLPVVAVVLAIAGLALAFARWRPRPAAPASEEDRTLVDRALRQESGGGGTGRDDG
jgi:cytochrome c-type biogenesis protein CcmH